MTTTTVLFGDLHAPHHDEAAVSKLQLCLALLRPQRVVLLGDMFDCYQLSSFDKDPRRLVTLQEDIDSGVEVIKSLLSVLPSRAKVVFLEGNHEFRLTRYLCRHPELASLAGLSPKKLFGLQNMDYVPYGKLFELDASSIAVHGHLVRKRAGMTAQAMLDCYGRSGCSGHTHRLAQVHRSTGGNRLTWVEAGCLCRLDPDYCHEGTVDWQHGYAVMIDGRLEARVL